MTLHGLGFRLSLTVALVVGAGGGVSCTPDPTPPPVRSLRGMSDAALLCMAVLDEDIEQGSTAPRQPRPVTSCPDFNADDGETRELYTLVTQPETGEVALVNLQTGSVVDSEVAMPGISFLPVGAEPISVVSTPGGVASFVATREPGKPGIYGLPTQCVAPRGNDSPFVDITSWSACRLPADPGAMTILIDPVERSSCNDAPDPAALQVGMAAAASRSDCPADLALEQLPKGRRKLLVALPSRGELAVIDAQAVLDRVPGSFAACPIERTLSLEVALPDPAPVQEMPTDLAPREPSCAPASTQPGSSGPFLPFPVDFAMGGNELYVADLGAPVVHVVDVHDPCELVALQPLLPQSYTSPDAVITTRKVALSPLTSTGQRFVYAIEESSAATAGSVMVFDVSDGSTSRTPIVRPGAPLIPHEPPDRIQFAQEAADVEFVSRQIAAFDPVTGVSVEQVSCDPLETDRTAPGAQFQPSVDLTAGASPFQLHGLFAFIGLYNGQIAVVDVEDLDAACRRPVSANPGGAADFRGCANDPNVDFEGLQTVSGEISCKVVQPHRARSSSFFINDARARAAALRQFPRLTSSTGRPLPTDQSEEGKVNPMLLAVPFSEREPAEVFVASSLYEAAAGATNELVIDPAKAEGSSVALSLNEPRQFLPNESFELTYEGKLGASANTRIEPQGASAVVDEGSGGRFCSSGVQDIEATRQFAQQFFPDGITASELNELVATHTDYVQLSGDFPQEADQYWQSDAGQSCGERLPRAEDVTPLVGYRFCELWFGTSDAPTLRRDLRVKEAYQNQLWLEPRYGGESPELLLELVGCCFPEMTPYTVRAGQQWVLRGSTSGFQHDLTIDSQTGRCVHSCDPAVQGRTGRAIEISCRGECELDSDGRPLIGLAAISGDFGRDLACVIDDPRGGVAPGRSGEECIFDDGPSRFAIYRGLQPSTRDMKFSWQLRGGFAPLTVSISRSNNSLPEKLQFVPNLQSLMVIDGGTAGLGVVRLDSLINRSIN